MLLGHAEKFKSIRVVLERRVRMDRTPYLRVGEGGTMDKVVALVSRRDQNRTQQSVQHEALIVFVGHSHIYCTTTGFAHGDHHSANAQRLGHESRPHNPSRPPHTRTPAGSPLLLHTRTVWQLKELCS
jgi:hypothetical protein